MKVQNAGLITLIRPSYDLESLTSICNFLQRHGSLDFIIKPNGLYAALTTDQIESVSGYTYTWIRDTIMITNYQAEVGNFSAANKTLNALCDYFDKHKERFVGIIEGNADKDDPMQRPHIRFNGDTLEEIDQQWAHAENDALGYALWMTFRLANQGNYTLTSVDRQVYALFPFYFEAIEYWHDKDSGHWEEARKIESSSIGVVVAALREMRKFILSNPSIPFEYANARVSIDQLDQLIAKGEMQLDSFLPFESPLQRLADAALLFLIYPLQVLADSQADEVLRLVLQDLLGEYGIKRYLGDSYWCANYKKLLKEEEWTVDFSDNIERRDKLLKPGTEAQWCLFDPIVSTIYGKRYLKSGNIENLNCQTYHFNRSLAQITSENFALGGGKCPEAYYIENLEDGLYVPNDHVPLGWTQANLGIAVKYMQMSLSH